MLRRIGAVGPAWAGALLLAALSSGCGKTVLALDVKPPASTPADGETPATIKIAVTRDGKPVDDASSGQVTVATDLGQFAVYGGATKDDPTQQSANAAVTQGEAKVQLFSVKAGTANLTVNYSDANGLKGSKTATVTFGNNGLVVTILPVTNSKADGLTPASVTVDVTKDGQPLGDSENGQLLLTTDIGQFQPYQPPNTTDLPEAQQLTAGITSGKGYGSFYAFHTGTAHLTAKVTLASGTSTSATATVTIAPNGSVTPASIQYLGATPPTLGLAGSGQAQTSTLSFKVLDQSAQPVADGVQVTFTISPGNGGAQISPLTALTATTLDGSGIATTQLTSGSAPASVIVTATAGGFSTSSQAVTIGGAGVNEGHLSLVCDAYRIAGFETFGLTNNCTVFASDRSGKFVPGSQVTLMTEAGSVPVTVTISDDPAQGGVGTFVYRTQCPFPKDVAPNASEYRLNNCNYTPQTACPGSTTHATCNPRDGLASLVAWVVGEECYHDNNNNGIYDGTAEFDPACDQGEPYVDENDNGRYDVGEQFADVNSNGTWDPPNGQWDSASPVWTSLKILWTGDVANVVPVSPAPSLGAKSCGASASFDVEVYDFNGNCPASVGTGDGINLSATSTTAAPTISLPNPIPTGDTHTAGQACALGGLDSNSLPYFSVNIVDSNGCSTSTPIPPPDSYTINASWNRTVASDGTSETDDMYNIAGGSFAN